MRLTIELAPLALQRYKKKSEHASTYAFFRFFNKYLILFPISGYLKCLNGLFQSIKLLTTVTDNNSHNDFIS